uniref:histidine kinase n=1 Tax=Thermus islandicus TaxID=540988 RepID=A0A831UHH1_9DEIN
MTLRTRITLLTAGLLLVTLLLLGFALEGLLRSFLYRNLRGELLEASNQVVRLLNLGGQALLEAGLPPSLYAEVQLLPEENPSLLAREGGISLQRSPALGSQRLVLKEADYRALLQAGEVWTEVGLPREGRPLPLLVYGRRVEVSLGGAVWKGILLVGKPTEGLEATLSQFARIYAGTALLVLFLALLLARSLVARALEPLEWVARKAEAMSARPEPLPEPETEDEVAALVKALNGMLSRLQEAFEAQTRFLQDASHELRTPLTAILGHVGYLLRRTPLTEAQRESLEVVKREAERMGKLVSDLLDLSQSGTWRIEPVPVRVLDLLEEVKEEFAKSFEGEIRVEAPEGLYVRGDPDRLHQVLANLVSEEVNVKQVVAKIQLGEADAALVYATDVTPAVRQQVTEIELPEQVNLVTCYPIAVVAGAPDQALARAFIDQVRSPEGQAVLERYGFRPVGQETVSLEECQ